MELYRIKRLVFSLGHETLFRRLNWRSLSVVALIAGLSVAALVVQNISINLSGAKFERGSDEILGMQLGLDLAGGTHLVFQPSSADLIPTDDKMDGLVRIIRDRVDNLGVAEPNIQRLGDQRLLVQLPGIEDVERASMDMSDESGGFASQAEMDEAFGTDYEAALQEELKLREEYGDNTAALRNFAERTASSASLGLSDYALVKAFGPKMAEALKQRKRLNKKLNRVSAFPFNLIY